MISTIVESAFETGYLSVESEGLIHQILSTKIYQGSDLKALKRLYLAVERGSIQREVKLNLDVKIPSI
ncbi:MAG: hypothetical protein AAF208_04490 [Cyanobacteria bacterium P01_A01_bin.45]